jgi:nitrogen-specific signal transduction histidine kinase
MAPIAPQPPPDRALPERVDDSWSSAALLLDGSLEESELERMILAAATHASGPGFVRAHLLAWNRDLASLDGRLVWRSGAARSLTATLSTARRQASDGTDPDATRRLRALRLTPGELSGPLARAWTTRRSDLGKSETLEAWEHALSIGASTLLKGGRPYALVVGEWEGEGDDSGRRAALEAWRAVANAALEAQAENQLARRRADQTRALAAIAHAVSSSLNLAELGNLLVREVALATAARGAVLWRRDDHGQLEVSSSYGPAGARDRLGRGLTPLGTQCVAAGRAVMLERAVDSDSLLPEVAAQISSAAVVPVCAYGQIRGALAVYDRLTQHPSERISFDAEDLALLTAIADQCGIALEQARGDEARKRMEQNRRDLLRQLERSERSAAQGERSVRVVQQARNPLASVAAFARRVHRNLAEDDPNREYLEVVIREAERVEQSLSRAIEPSSPDPPQFRIESVNALLQASLQQVSEQLVRRRVRLLKKLSPDLPPLLLDTERLQRVIQNVLDQALQRVHPGGRVRVESRRVHQFVLVEIAHDGRAEAGEILGELFVPFALPGDQGADLGLAVARQVVWQHGGEVRVRSEGEWSTVFTLSLPIRSNEDRRKPGTERRVTRHDRRQRAPSA